MAFRNRATGEYPVSKAALIAANPNTSFPAAWDASVLDYLGVDEVTDTPRPLSTRFAEVTEGTPVEVDGVWARVWNVADIRDSLDADGLAALFAALKSETKANVADKRWQAEVGGVNFGGLRIATDRVSQGLVAGATMLAEVRPELLIDWKTTDGWVQISNGQLAALSLTVGLHVQSCFRRERELNDAIDAAQTIADLLQIDITAGWPS